MNTLHNSLRAALVWAAPFAALAVLLLWQTDWGRAFARTPPAETAVAPQPLTLALLPEYQPQASAEANRDVVERTLFNPTRRPAPQALADTAKPRIQRGQFALAGTLVVDGKATAYLREVNGGKSRRVSQGETINGMVVSEIKADRVRLSVGDENEDLSLKIATGPKSTIQPVIPGAAGAPVTANAPANATPGGQSGPITGARDVSEILAERRRAARAAELAAQGLPPGAPIAQGSTAPVQAPTMPPVPTVDPKTGDPAWQGVYQRYQQPRGR
jgi:hypothetical protein